MQGAQWFVKKQHDKEKRHWYSHSQTEAEEKKAMKAKSEDEADGEKELLGSTNLLGVNLGTK